LIQTSCPLKPESPVWYASTPADDQNEADQGVPCAFVATATSSATGTGSPSRRRRAASNVWATSVCLRIHNRVPSRPSTGGAYHALLFVPKTRVRSSGRSSEAA